MTFPEDTDCQPSAFSPYYETQATYPLLDNRGAHTRVL